MNKKYDTEDIRETNIFKEMKIFKEVNIIVTEKTAKACKEDARAKNA